MTETGRERATASRAGRVVAAARRALRFGEREEARWVRRLVDDAPDALLVMQERALVFASARAAELWGAVSPGSLLGRGYEELFSRESAAAVEALARESAPLGVTLRTLSGGVVAVDARGARTLFRGRPAQLIALHCAAPESALVRRARRREQVEVVGRLASGVAHDLNNQLTVVLGRTDALREQLAGDPRAKRDLDAIARAVERSASVARKLLAVARRAPLDAQRLALGPLAREVAEGLRTPEAGTLSLEIAPAPLFILGDRDQLAQALAELARYALAVGGAHGPLALRMLRAVLPLELCEPGAGPGSTLAALRIEVGSAPFASPSEALDVFTALGSGAALAGLELAGALGIVAQAHGCIGVQRSPTGGIALTIYFPPAPTALAISSRTASGSPVSS